jgi:hypothetical protein
MRTFSRYFFCVLFFLASLTPEAYCIQAKFKGLKIDKIASKDSKSSSQIRTVKSDHLDDLLQRQHFANCGQEELPINFDYDNTEEGSLTDTDEEDTQAKLIGEMFFSKDATKDLCYNYSRSLQSKRGPHGNKKTI